MANARLTLQDEKRLRRFRATGVAVIITLYLVVLAGGVVRMTGSGMGCPDWPKCFDGYIPPFSEADLPPDYHERLDPGHGNVEFNVTKAWIEYVNRLVSVVAGFVMLAFVWAGFRLRKWAGGSLLFGLTLTALVLLLFEAWLGKKVVDTNLRVGMITIHMLVAVGIVCVTLLAMLRATPNANHTPKQLGGINRALAIGLFATTFIQIGLGTQVREAVDLVSNHLSTSNRADWLSQAGAIFIIHRTVSWGVLAFAALLAWRMRRTPGPAQKWAMASLAFVLLAVALGIVLQQFDMPALAQPLHLLAGILLVGAQFGTIVKLWPAAQIAPRQGLNLVSPIPTGLPR